MKSRSNRTGGQRRGARPGFGRLAAKQVGLIGLIGLILALAAPAGRAQDDVAGAFDYYVLALSWSPGWCMVEGDAKNAPQCRDGAGKGFVLHGLWPQYEQGWPSYCRTEARDPSRRETAERAGLFGSAGLAWHQWKKHGRCSGLSAQAYFDLAQRAFDMVARPQVFGQLSEQVRVAPAVVEAAFLETNQQFQAPGVTVTCRNAVMYEVRICLTPQLTARHCAPDTAQDCRLDTVIFPPTR
ncbi:MAG: ribonuclease T2 [Pseudomonadota bacterium]